MRQKAVSALAIIGHGGGAKAGGKASVSLVGRRRMMKGERWPELCRAEVHYWRMRALAVMFVVVVAVLLEMGELVSASDEQSKLNDMIQREILKRNDQQPQSSDAEHGSVKCIHGYLSAADKSTCVCNYGWVGLDCAENALPTCVR